MYHFLMGYRTKNAECHRNHPMVGWFIPRIFSLDPKCTFYEVKMFLSWSTPAPFTFFFCFSARILCLGTKKHRNDRTGRGLGSSSGAILETIIDEVLENECVLTLCTLRAQSKAPSQKRRAVCVAFVRKKQTSWSLNVTGLWCFIFKVYIYYGINIQLYCTFTSRCIYIYICTLVNIQTQVYFEDGYIIHLQNPFHPFHASSLCMWIASWYWRRTRMV